MQNQYIRARYYRPVIARWLSVDPLLFNEDVNAYEAFRNTPLSRRDASGLLPSDLVSSPVNACSPNESCVIGQLHAFSFYQENRQENVVDPILATGIGFAIFLTIDASGDCPCCTSFEFVQVVCERNVKLSGTITESCSIDRDRRLPSKSPYYGDSSQNSSYGRPPVSIPPTQPPIGFPEGTIVAAMFDRPDTPRGYLRAHALKSTEDSFWACAVCLNVDGSGDDYLMMPCVKHFYRRVDDRGVAVASGPDFVSARSRVTSIAESEGYHFGTC